MMRLRTWAIAFSIVALILASIVLVFQQPPQEVVNSGEGRDDWLNGEAKDLSDYIVQRQQNDFDWANMTEAPTWRIGDKWTYDGRLDASSVIDDAGVEGAAINDLLTGDSFLQVDDLSIMQFSGEDTLTYSLHLWGTFSGLATFPVPLLQTYTDTLVVRYDAYEYIRMSDLAIMNKSENLQIEFEHPFGVESIADISIESTYNPPLEWWDFPLGLNETWLANHEITEIYSGSSNYVDLPTEDEKEQNNWRFINIEEGFGKDQNSDCNNSRNVTAFNEENKAKAWRWFCPSVGQWSWRVGEVPLGVTGDFRLTSYQPSSTRESTPEISVEMMQRGVNKSITVGLWVNSTYQNMSFAGVQGELFYGCCEIISFTTDENGSAWITLNSGNNFDTTPTFDDLASHGIIAKINGTDQAGIASLTIYGSALGEELRTNGATQQWQPHSLGIHHLSIAASVL
ncbi:MAG TPA: hypothetical protein EYQ53_04825 [Candidatus Poseidoniales archaeon]|nr:MAG: hypothetical protein CXT69_01750 [Euryarchaeota archaeon]HIG03685.1 hypothetical protein [Candidatus Poseidoniales archaeon]HIK78105.1 hypothetical protein [Candidatus Poseidoniales archaeon]